MGRNHFTRQWYNQSRSERWAERITLCGLVVFSFASGFIIGGWIR
jgi:hypothetical protein